MELLGYNEVYILILICNKLLSFGKKELFIIFF